MENEKKKRKYKFKDYFRKWGFTSIRLNFGFAEAEFSPSDDDQTAAWDMYVELLTRISTQPLEKGYGDEKSSLDSIHDLFGITRRILHEKGRNAENFTKISIIILNQIVRPFTTKWHSISLKGGFEKKETRKEYRKELKAIQDNLIRYTRLLADLAMVEDLTTMEDDNNQRV